MKNGRSGKQGEFRNARVVAVFRGNPRKKQNKARIAFARILKEFMRKNKIKKRNVPPCTFEEYKKIYDKFWSDKTKVNKKDVDFMVKLINERTK